MLYSGSLRKVNLNLFPPKYLSALVKFELTGELFPARKTFGLGVRRPLMPVLLLTSFVLVLSLNEALIFLNH